MTCVPDPVEALRLPLSPAQERLWHAERSDELGPGACRPVIVRLDDPLSEDVLRSAVRWLVRRHPALRTTFSSGTDGVRQAIHADGEAEIAVIDITADDQHALDEVVRRASTVMRLSTGPLMRVVLARLPSRTGLLALAAHPLIADDHSLALLLEELAVLYRCGPDNATQAKPLDSWIHYLRRVTAHAPGPAAPATTAPAAPCPAPAIAPALDGRAEMLAPIVQVDLPTDLPRPPTRSVRAATWQSNLPAQLSTRLHGWAAVRGVSTFEVLLTAFVAVLARYTGQPDLSIGVGGRERRGDLGVVGRLADHFVLTVHAGDDPHFGQLLERIRAATAVGEAASLLPLDQFLGLAQPTEDPSRPPLVPIVFQLAQWPERDPGLGVAGAPLPQVAPATSRYELQVDVRLSSGGAQLSVRHLCELYSAETVDRLLGNYVVLLAGALDTPERPLSRLPLLTDEEQRLMLVDWNATAADLDHHRCLHEHVAARADADPDATAIVYGSEQVTYRQVDTRASQLAQYLLTRDLRTSDRVGLCLRPGPALLVAMVGVLKAGCAFVSLDVDYPADRLEFMMRDAGCRLLLADTYTVGRLPPLDIPTIRLDRDAEEIAAARRHRPLPTSDPDDLCYIIYTSGSTGQPKGIALSHRGVANNLLDLNTRFGVSAGDRILALSSTSFDMSVYELLGSAVAGATVVVPDPGLARDPEHWADLVARHKVSVWNSAPALLELFLGELERHGLSRAPSIRLAMLGGDWIPVTLPDRLRAQSPYMRFVALGGATEASIHSTIHEVTEVDPTWTAIPYGIPLANQRTYVLDSAMQPVPVGVPGELYLAGVGLARGYLGRPELTAQRFQSWSFGPVRNERVYRTGDRARYRPDGVLELLGRVDFQVKIRGLRIELGEVEAALRRHPEVSDAVVLARPDGAGDRRLVGYLVARDGRIDLDLVRTSLSRTLPQFMIPTALLVLPALPLNPNGKVDRRALPDPREGSSGPADRGAAGPVANLSPPASTESQPSGSACPYPSEGELERQVAAVFATVLGLDQVGCDENFFALGGDSWKAIMAIRAIGADLQVTALYRHPTVRGLAGRLRAASATVHTGPPLSENLSSHLGGN